MQDGSTTDKDNGLRASANGQMPTSDLVPSAPAPAAGPADFQHLLSGARVLLVEDEIFIAIDTEYQLQDAGVTVLGPAATLEKGLEIANSNEQIDAAILDIKLGKQEVFPIADVLKKRGIPIVFHTGHGLELDLATDYPTAGVCRKPVLPNELVTTVAAQISAAGGRAAG